MLDLKINPIRYRFERAVETYEKAGRIQKRVAQELLKRIEKKHYSTIVEIGSGRGFLSIPLTKTLTFERFIHIDISFGFLKRLKADLNNSHFFINASAENMAIKHGLADLLISSSTLHWFQNPEENLLKLFDILKENGLFHFSIFTSGTLKELREASELTRFGSVYPLKDADFYLQIMQKTGFHFDYKIETYREIYDSPKDLLLTHKLTGTNYTKNGKFSGKKSYMEFCNTYKRLFGNNRGIYATYEVLFIEGQK